VSVAGGITAALSGGGAKAAAHVGALRVLAAAGVVPTRYVATSMGAVIAVMIAAGVSLEDIADKLRAIRRSEIFRVDRTGVLRGWFAPSLLRAEPFRKVLERLLPVSDFSALGIPLSITATDLDSGELLVFGDGGEAVPLLDAICASTALPPFFAPYPLGGRRCADGGLRGVVPLEVAARFPAELVVAVDVGSGFDLAPDPEPRREPALLALMNDAKRILMASNTAAQHALWLRTPERPPLLWIRPQVRRGETFATEALEWYFAEGERAARDALLAHRS
jgi:NTE family protein